MTRTLTPHSYFGPDVAEEPTDQSEYEAWLDALTPADRLEFDDLTPRERADIEASFALHPAETLAEPTLAEFLAAHGLTELPF